MTAAPANPYESAQRERKAQRLAHHVMRAVITTATNPGPKHDEFWAAAIKGCNYEDASEDTKKRVVQILRMLRPVKQEGWDL